MTFESEMFPFLLQRNKKETEGDAVNPYKGPQLFLISMA